MEPVGRTSAFGTSTATAERVTAFLRTVYGWMCAGLAITAVVAFSIASSPALIQAVVMNRLLFIGLFVGQIALVFYLSARVDRLAPGTAALLFVVYSALTGVTLSVLVLAYTGASIATTFVVTAGMFGALALYGSTTTRSLAGVGQFLFMGLVGLVLASLVGMFWHSEALQFLISVVGVIVFTGLDGLGCAAAEGDGPRRAGGAARLLRDRGRALALSRLHQPLRLPAPLPRKPSRMISREIRASPALRCSRSVLARGVGQGGPGSSEAAR